MPWVKLTDKLHENDKLGGVSDAAFRLWVLALSWSNDKLTDGHIPTSRPMRLVSLRNPKKTTAELVEAKLWHVASRPCKACVQLREERKVREPIPSGGWIIHDYFLFQRPKWVIVAERERLKTIGAEGGKASAETRWQPKHEGQASSSSTQLDQTADLGKHAAQAPSSSSELNRNGLNGKHEGQASRSTPYSRTPVSPSSGAIAPVPSEDDPFPEDADLSIRGRRRRGPGLRHVGEIADGVLTEHRGRATR